MDLNYNLKTNLNNPHYGDNITISSEKLSILKHEVAKLVDENKLLKEQLKDFDIREIGHIRYCSVERCSKWQAECYGDNISDHRVLVYCYECYGYFCKDHVSNIPTVCVSCYEKG